MKLLLIVAVAGGFVLALRSGYRYLAGIYNKAESDDATNAAWYG